MREDRRIRKTKSSIKHAFTQLLKEKDLEKITISDITNRADINRGTFYLHYEDKYLLLNDMEDECISELSNIAKFNEIHGGDVDEISRLFIDKILHNILQHIFDNLEFYQTILQLERKSRLEEKLSHLIKENMLKYLHIDSEIDGIPKMYFHSYVSGATMSVIKYWVQDTKRISVEDLTQHIYKIVYKGPLKIMAEHRYNQIQQ